MEIVKKLKDILSIYPNYMDGDLPHSVRCLPLQNGELNLNLTFQRILPNSFKIKNIHPLKVFSGCFCVVQYVLADGSPLPLCRALKPLTDSITKYAPTNTVIIDRRIYLPYIVELTYGVCCECDPLEYEVVEHKAAMHLIKEELDKINMN